MTEYDNTDTIVLFTVKPEDKVANGPSSSGTAEVVCPYCKARSLWRAASWLNTARESGNVFQKIRLTWKESPD